MRLSLLTLFLHELAFLLVGALVVSALTNWILLRRFRSYKARPVPSGQVRWSSQSKPAVGGISFAVALVYGMLFIADMTTSITTRMWLGVGAGAGIAFVVGLIDDFRHVSAFRKLLMQLACAGLVLFCGLGVTATGSLWINSIITVLWVVGLMNAVNMLDNMDGITALTSVFSAGFLAVSAALNTGGAEALLFSVLIAGIFGFLLFNWHPSKMYMGDAGSQLLGFLLATGSIVFGWNINDQQPGFDWHTMLVPLLVMALPLTDTAVVIINRLSHGVSPSTGGRDHTTHNLSYLGLRDNMVAVTYSFLGMINLIWALWVAYAEPTQFVIFTATGWGLLVFLAFFFISRYNLRRGKYSYNKA